ncbi:hypothetical protein [Paraburkholderia sp. A1RO-1]|uniref:hypothetical protein n=1 Tax=Paraburkholderia sp. A1RO-1 TaxID=3028368 RepID=UPI003B81758A
MANGIRNIPVGRPAVSLELASRVAKRFAIKNASFCMAKFARACACGRDTPFYQLRDALTDWMKACSALPKAKIERPPERIVICRVFVCDNTGVRTAIGRALVEYDDLYFSVVSPENEPARLALVKQGEHLLNSLVKAAQSPHD